MRLIIAGSRHLHDAYSLVCQAMQGSGYLPLVTEVVCGCAYGVDTAGEWWANLHRIPVTSFPADWSKGKRAGPVRNRQMAHYADALLLIWDGKSKGSANMLEEMEALGKPVCMFMVEES